MSFPRYPAYKDSGVEWIGAVPSHWGIKPLKHNLRLITLRATKKTNPLGLENIESWTGRLVPTDADFEGDGIAFEAEDILFGKLRPYLAKVYLAERTGEAVGDFHVLRPILSHVSRFAQYQMLTRAFIDVVDGSTFGSKMPRASWEFIGSLRLPLPPATEQRTIAAFLDRETAKIDALIAEQERLIALLQEKRQAVISHAVTKGLDPNVPMKESGDSLLGEVPEHWKLSALKHMAAIMPSGLWGQEPSDDLILRPVATTAHLSKDGDFCVEDMPVRGFTEAELQTFECQTDDIVIVKSSGSATNIISGKSGIVHNGSQRFVFSNFLMLVRPNSTQAYAPFLALLLRSHLTKQRIELMCSTTTYPNLKVGEYISALLPQPPLSEQREIVRTVAGHSDSIAASIQSAASCVDLLRERRSALITAAVTGQIDVRGLVETAA